MSKEYKSHEEQRQFWQMAVETWRSSGLSVRDFCKQEGLSASALYSWRKKLAGSDEAVEMASSPAFIEVTMPEDKPAPLELVLISGNILRIDTAVGSVTLTNVFSALREAGLC